MPEIARKALAEMLATFLFVFVIINAVANAEFFAPVAIGLALMVLVYATGHISGAHLNPAVSLGVFIRGKMDAAEMGIYMGAQFVGALLAAVFALLADLEEPTAAEIDIVPAFFVEMVITFILVWVVLNVATSKETEDNSYFGLAIGGTVMAGAFAVGPISGGGFNPAVALGLSVNGNFDWAYIWLYVLAPLLGAALAALAFRALSTADFENPTGDIYQANEELATPGFQAPNANAAQNVQNPAPNAQNAPQNAPQNTWGTPQAGNGFQPGQNPQQ